LKIWLEGAHWKEFTDDLFKKIIRWMNTRTIRRLDIIFDEGTSYRIIKIKKPARFYNYDISHSKK